MSPETVSPTSQASDQPGDNNSSPPTPRMHGKPDNSFKSKDNLMVGVSFLTNAYKQFANKTVMDASKIDFLHPFFAVSIHKLQNRPSMLMSPRQSQGGATCMPQIPWVPFCFLLIWRVRRCMNLNHM